MQWRSYLDRHPAAVRADIDELENHLRAQLADLTAVGLSEDEAFLVAVKRLGGVDALSRDFAREHSDRLWKQLVLTPDTDRPGGTASRDLLMALVFAARDGAGQASSRRVQGGGASPVEHYWARLPVRALSRVFGSEVPVVGSGVRIT